MTNPDGVPSGANDPEVLSGSGGDTGTSTTTEPAGTTATTPEPTAAATVSRTEYDAVINRLRAADKRRQEFEDQLKQIKDKDLPEAEKLKRDNEVLAQQVETLRKQVKDQAIDVAFRNETYTWHDPKAARALLDLAGVDVSEDGTVTGMKDAAKRLAEANPWMLKADDNSTKPQDSPTAGAPPMNGRAGTDGKPNKDALLRRFPAMRTRTGG